MTRSDILLVDDDVPLGRTLAELLRRHGYHVVLAHHGREALKQLERSRFALVISDIFMPEGDGIELLNHLRGRAPAPPLLAMSGGDSSQITGMLKIAGALGAIHTLSKPFEPSVLLGLVNELIGPPAGAVAG